MIRANTGKLNSIPYFREDYSNGPLDLRLFLFEGR